ncbi:type III pantothenate kinase [Tepidanaerobacter acetatoxydans]|uniref:type III pantothenate kinase n=1 Tax=Tepidanaerobacter acetatoxydans TaxID=499229 RepID=UPI001BD3317E|nr:type III pantothenate kinase [Tepidanaerobacter acetatoxydans]
MILAIDVGNTNLVFGIYENDKLKASYRTATHHEYTEDEYSPVFNSMLSFKDINPASIEGGIISSVVPSLTIVLEKMCKKYFNFTPIVVGPGIKSGINIKYENPKEVGADRIVNAAAAFHKYGGPVIIVDFGTATTFDALTAECDYLGGAIAPGIGISSEALFKTAAKLYRVEIAKPEKVIGKNTATSIQSGIYNGYVGLVENIVEKMKEEMGGGHVFTVATGGLAFLICSTAKNIDTVDMMLTLDGLKLIYEKNVS